MARLLNITNLTIQVLHCNIQGLSLQHINTYPRQACFNVTCSESSCIIYPQFILYSLYYKYRNRTQLNQVSQGRGLFVTAVSSEYISHIANNTHVCGWTLVNSGGPLCLFSNFIKYNDFVPFP